MPAAHVLMTTTVGPMTLELDADNAPKTVENFLSYVAGGFYNGTIFHRVIDNHDSGRRLHNGHAAKGHSGAYRERGQQRPKKL